MDLLNMMFGFVFLKMMFESMFCCLISSSTWSIWGINWEHSNFTFPSRAIWRTTPAHPGSRPQAVRDDRRIMLSVVTDGIPTSTQSKPKDEFMQDRCQAMFGQAVSGAKTEGSASSYGFNTEISSNLEYFGYPNFMKLPYFLMMSHFCIVLNL